MKQFLSIIFLSLACLATVSVGYASPPAVHQLPTIKKNAVHIFAQAFQHQYTIKETFGGNGPDHVPLIAAMHGQYFMGAVYLQHDTEYKAHYGLHNKSMLNYWPGYERLV